MPRELSAEVEEVKDSSSFTYFDTIEIRLPMGPGDVTPRVLQLSTAEISVTPSLDFAEFIYKAFTGALGRTPTGAEHNAWLTALTTGLASGQAALRTAAETLIEGLFDSTEYDDRMRGDDQYIMDLYAAILGRLPEEGGKQFWLDELAGSNRLALRGAFLGADEFTDRLALMSLPVANEPDTRDMGDLTLSDGDSTDMVEFGLTNLENTYSDLIGQAGRRLYPAPAVIKRVFKLPDNSYEAVEMLIGFARFSSVDGLIAKVSVPSDLSRRNVDVVETVTQHCINIYKGADGWCGSPDPSPTCSRIKDDAVNGCASKMPAPQLIDISPPDNRPSFRGVVQSSLTTPSTGGVGIDPADAGPGGWPGDHDPFDPRFAKFDYQMPFNEV